MKTTAIALALLVLQALYSHGQGKAQIGFGEVDYRQRESEGVISVVVTKIGVLQSDLYLNVIPLTYDEFLESGYEIPDDGTFSTLPDPAEYEENGRNDFDNTTQEVVVSSGTATVDHSVSILINNDLINEADEGFLVVVRANEDKSDPQDVAELEYVGNGVTLAIISDDDAIELLFESPTYTFSEEDGHVDDIIYVVKQSGDVSEQILSVTVGPNDMQATLGQDYNASDIRLDFQPEVDRLPVPITLLEDSLAEPGETFQLVMSRVQDTPAVNLQQKVAVITIQDNDEVLIGLEQTAYTTNEGENIEACAAIFSPEEIDPTLIAIARLTVIPGTADENDYDPFLNFVTLSDGDRRQCFNLSIVADSVAEHTENLTVVLEHVAQATPRTVIIAPEEATVLINSDECREGSHDCDENAECSDTSDGFDCTCLPGFTGDGRTCVDIDECSDGTHDCNTNLFCRVGASGGLMCGAIAECTNTQGSYECNCVTGYSGDGRTCTDINECAAGMDDCDSNADCTNLPGSYTCTCRDGYEGDGQTCTDIDECATNTHDCDSNAECVNNVGSYMCICKPGFEFEADGKSCADINECNRGLDDCNTFANCINTAGSYQCQCMAGYQGDGKECIATQVEVNECELGTHDCSRNADCIDLVDGYDCQCHAGFSGNGRTCRDVDECTARTYDCHENARCVNTVGSYTCRCRRGYTGNGRRCRDINECAQDLDNCHQNAYCINNVGSFSCMCQPGYTGDGVACTAIQQEDPCDEETSRTRTRSRSRTSGRTTGRRRTGTRTTTRGCGEETTTRTTRKKTRKTG